MPSHSVKYAELRPAEFLKRLNERPVAYLPLGTLEWHGEHLPLGADAIQSESLMIEAANKFGGIVLPPLFLGPDRRMELENGSTLIGMDYAKSTDPARQLTGSAYWVSYEFFRQLLENILEQLKRAGFKAVFAEGHGPSRRTWSEMISEWEKIYDLRLFGISDDQRSEWNYMNDHAAKNETSITQFVSPGLVNLDVFADGVNSPLVGVNGEHPAMATAAYGEKLFNHALQMLGEWVRKVDPLS